MAVVIFLIFIVAPYFVAYVYARSAKILRAQNQSLRLREIEVKERGEEAERRITEASSLKGQATRLRNEADRIVTDVKEENHVLKIAASSITNYWINDTFQSILDRLTSDNYETQKSRLEKAFESCRSFGIAFHESQKKNFFDRLKNAWNDEKAIQRAKDEQDRIRELMREEQRAEKTRQAELKKLEAESREIEKRRKENEERLKMLREVASLRQLTEEQKRELDSLSTENVDLAKQLEEKERRKSMAELTRAGHIYVISNVGSFGERVYKIGMTRRLIPEERVKELGDASVPFPFDIHMMVATEDAPTLEKKLHKALWKSRLNLINDRREFFKADLSEIKELVDKYGGGVLYEFKENAQASQYRESEKRRAAKEFGDYSPIVSESPNEDDEVVAS